MYFSRLPGYSYNTLSRASSDVEITKISKLVFLLAKVSALIRRIDINIPFDSMEQSIAKSTTLIVILSMRSLILLLNETEAPSDAMEGARKVLLSTVIPIFEGLVYGLCSKFSNLTTPNKELLTVAVLLRAPFHA